MRTFGWTVLALVFLDELLAVAAFGVWGWTTPQAWLLVWLLPLVAMAVWFLFASPQAQHGGPVVRPIVKGLVFCSATLALWHAGHTDWAVAFLAFSVVVNALAQVRAVRELLAEQSAHSTG